MATGGGKATTPSSPEVATSTTARRSEPWHTNRGAPPKLKVVRQQIAFELEGRISPGEAIRHADLSDPAGMKDAWAERSAWHDFDVELLEQRFTTSSIAEDYGWYPGTRSFGG